METLRQPAHHLFTVTEEADTGAARRAVAGYADDLGMTSERRGRAELAVTELATNLLRHAEPGGWILARPAAPDGIELIAVDRGPGIADVDAAVAGRTPTPHGLGAGLAAVRRTASTFDLHSETGVGTAVLAVVDRDGSRTPAPRCCAGVSVGVTQVCGDGWAVAEVDGGLAVAVVDGLGHGPRASTATDAALAVFSADPADLDGFARRANEALRATRGAAVTVCLARPEQGELRYLSIGNISGRLLCGGQERGLAVQSGTLGLQATPPRVRTASYPWPPAAALVLWTDGLASRIDLSAAAPLLTHDPAVVAATLHREHTRRRDDATVVVVRHLEPP